LVATVVNDLAHEGLQKNSQLTSRHCRLNWSRDGALT